MGQSIKHITLATIAKEALEEMAVNTDKYFFKEDYRLGNGYCTFSQMDSEILYDIIYSNYCDVVRVLEGSLEGDSSVCRPDMNRNKVINWNGTCCTEKTGCETDQDCKNALYEIWRSKGNTGTIEEFYEELFKDEKMNWYDVKWQ